MFFEDSYSHKAIPNAKTEKMKPILKSEQANSCLIYLLLRMRIRRLKRPIKGWSWMLHSIFWLAPTILIYWV